MTTITQTKLEQAKSYAKAEYAKQDTSLNQYRKDCLKYLNALAQDAVIIPQTEAKLVSTITTGSHLEAWKALTLVWLENTSYIPDGMVKGIWAEEINGATDKNQYLIQERISDEVGKMLKLDFENISDAWLKSSESHYVILSKETQRSPKPSSLSKERLSREDYWFINEVRLRYWYKILQLKEEARKEAQVKPMPPPPPFMWGSE